MSASWEYELQEQLLEKADKLPQKQLYKLGLLFKTTTKELTRHFATAYAYCKDKKKIATTFRKLMRIFRGSKLDDLDVWSVDHISAPEGYRVAKLKDLPQIIKQLYREALDEVISKLPPNMREKDIEIGGNYILIGIQTESRGVIYQIYAQADAYTAEALTHHLYQKAQSISKAKPPEVYLSRIKNLEIVEIDEEEGYVWCA